MKTAIAFINRRLPVARKMTLTLLAVGLVGSTSLASDGGTRPRPVASLEQKGAQLLMERVPPKPRLPSDLDHPAFSALARGWAALPKTTHLVRTVHNGVPADVAVHEVGTGPRVVVCLHGVFGQSANWKYIAGALAGDYQLWLPDLPGCGESDSLPSGKSGPGGYGPLALAERVLQALETRLAARPDVGRFLLAGHSLGGMVALRMFTDDGLRERFAPVLARADGLVLFAPCDVVLTQATEEWITVLGLNATMVRLGDVTGLLQVAMEKSVRSGFCDPALATRELAEEGVHLLKNGRQRRAAVAMMLDAIPFRVFGKVLDWEAVEELEAHYQKVPVPCLIVWGHRDQSLTVSMGYKMKDEIPNAGLVIVPQTMHLLPLERPGICADLIREFDGQLRTGGLPAAGTVCKLPLGVLPADATLSSGHDLLQPPIPDSTKLDKELAHGKMLPQ
jgi:pimeloyl-ACP methyl ester carboxylesterase